MAIGSTSTKAQVTLKTIKKTVQNAAYRAVDNVVTLTFAADHYFKLGEPVTLKSMTALAFLNGRTGYITRLVPGANPRAIQIKMVPDHPHADVASTGDAGVVYLAGSVVVGGRTYTLSDADQTGISLTLAEFDEINPALISDANRPLFADTTA